MSFTRLLALLSLLVLVSCQSARYPAPVHVKAKPPQPHYAMVQAVRSGEAAEQNALPEHALSAWLRTAQEAALLIEDRTTCGDGSISRVKVTRVYQHAVGRVLTLLQGREVASPGGKRWPSVPTVVRGPEGTWSLRVQTGPETSISSIEDVGPVPAPGRISAFHVGVPVEVNCILNGRTISKVLTALIEFPAISTDRSHGRALISFRDGGTGSSLVRLHPAGPQLPLRRSADRPFHQ